MSNIWPEICMQSSVTHCVVREVFWKLCLFSRKLLRHKCEL